MKTIAVTIDEETLERVDELALIPGRYSSRSALVRDALAGYVAREQRLLEEDRERRIIRRHKETLGEELAALVAEQAQA